MSKDYAPPNKLGSGFIQGDCGHTVKVLDDGYECVECFKMALSDFETFMQAFIKDWEADPIYIDQVYYNRGKELLDIYQVIKDNKRYEQNN